MAVNPAEFMTVAEELIVKDEEVYWRTAASRAYYSAYHECDHLARKMGLDLSLPKADGKFIGSHDRLINALLAEDDSDIKTIAGLLVQVKHLRRDADYKLRNTFQRVDAEQTIKTAISIRIKVQAQ